MQEIQNKAVIKVIGVGGAGGNAINDMIESNIKDVEFIVANTDSQDLDHSRSTNRIHLGDRATKGLGAGADPDKGRVAAEESMEKIRQALEGTDMLFITAGMGGGTGTGASPVVAEVAKELGILTVAIVTKPFTFEGPQRKLNADEGLKNLGRSVDTLIAVPNDKLFELPNLNITLMNAFKEANNILRAGVRGISELITRQGYVNLDFADIKTIMENSGVAMLGFGEAQGEDRARIATEQALNSPLLEKSIEGAKKILLNITGGYDLGLNEVQEVSSLVREKTGEANSNLIFGTVLDEATEGIIRISIVATDFDEMTLKDSFAVRNADVQVSPSKENTEANQSNENIDEVKEQTLDEAFLVPPFVQK